MKILLWKKTVILPLKKMVLPLKMMIFVTGRYLENADFKWLLNLHAAEGEKHAFVEV